MLFLCHVTAVSDPLQQGQLLPMAGSEPSPPPPPCSKAAQRNLFLQTDFLLQSAACLAGEVRCALCLSAPHISWQPHKKHLKGRVNAPAGSCAQLAIYTVCGVNLLQFWLSGILQVYFHIPTSPYWFPTEILSHQPKMKWLIETALASLCSFVYFKSLEIT